MSSESDFDSSYATALNAAHLNSLQHHPRYTGPWDFARHQHMFDVLEEEVKELFDALYGVHKHPPELELIQIAGIAINWLAAFDAIAIDSALERTTQEHAEKLRCNTESA